MAGATLARKLAKVARDAIQDAKLLRENPEAAKAQRKKIIKIIAKDPETTFKKIKGQIKSGKLKNASDISPKDWAVLRKSKGFIKQREAVKDVNPTVLRAIKAGDKKTVDGVDVSLWAWANKGTSAKPSNIRVGTVAKGKGSEIKSMKFLEEEAADIMQPTSPKKKATGGLSVTNTGRTGRFGHSDYRGNN